MDIFLLIVLLAITGCSWFIPSKLKKSIEKDFSVNPRILPPDNKAPLTLFRINFIMGAKLFGKFRYKQVEGVLTCVSYYFIFVYVPLIPIMCYRVIDEGLDTFRILGSDKMRGKELLCIYMQYYRWVFSVLTIIGFIYQFT